MCIWKGHVSISKYVWCCMELNRTHCWVWLHNMLCTERHFSIMLKICLLLCWSDQKICLLLCWSSQKRSAFFYFDPIRNSYSYYADLTRKSASYYADLTRRSDSFYVIWLRLRHSCMKCLWKRVINTNNLAPLVLV